MKQTVRFFWLTSAGLLLALPTAYFICISIFKYELGVQAPFDSNAPFLERTGIKGAPGWNINLLVLPLNNSSGIPIHLYDRENYNW